jgi:hypothetical protein
MPRVARTTALLLLFVPSVLGAQEFPLDRCTSPAPVGYLKAAGVVRYSLGDDGRPDTASVVVVRRAEPSVATLRSAAVRQLSACRMRRPRTATLVVQEIVFDSANVRIGPAIPIAPDETVLEGRSQVVLPDLVAAGDSTIEERLRWLDCERPPRYRPVSTTGRSRAADQGAAVSASPESYGMVIVRLTVGTDGTVVPGSDSLTSSTNPASTSNLLRSLRSCRFAPSRIGGGAVVTRASVTMISSGSNWTVSLMRAGRDVLMPR